MTDLDPRPYDRPLFPAAPTRGTARQADPATSEAAAKAKNPSADQSRCLAALVANGGTGTIDTVCAVVTDRDRGCLSRRLTDLESAGMIAKTDRTVTGSRGREVTVYEVI